MHAGRELMSLLVSAGDTVVASSGVLPSVDNGQNRPPVQTAGSVHVAPDETVCGAPPLGPQSKPSLGAVAPTDSGPAQSELHTGVGRAPPQQMEARPSNASWYVPLLESAGSVRAPQPAVGEAGLKFCKSSEVMTLQVIFSVLGITTLAVMRLGSSHTL